MEEGEGRGELRRLQIEVELLNLRGSEQALVDDGAAAEGADVETLDLGPEDEAFGGILGEEELTLEFVVGGVVLAGDKGLDDERKGLDGLAAEAGGVDRDLAPAEEGKTFGLHGGLDDLFAMRLRVVVALGQEDHSHAEIGVAEEGLVDRGQVVLEELDRKLGKHTGSVAGDRVGVDGAAVGEGFERRQRAIEHVIRPLACQLGNEANAAGIVFLVSGIERRRNDLGHGNLKERVDAMSTELCRNQAAYRRDKRTESRGLVGLAAARCERNFGQAAGNIHLARPKAKAPSAGANGAEMQRRGALR